MSANSISSRHFFLPLGLSDRRSGFPRISLLRCLKSLVPSKLWSRSPLAIYQTVSLGNWVNRDNPPLQPKVLGRYSLAPHPLLTRAMRPLLLSDAAKCSTQGAWTSASTHPLRPPANVLRYAGPRR